MQLIISQNNVTKNLKLKMSWVRIWVHIVFSTKNREPYLSVKEIREKIFQHIKHYANEKGIWLDTINGYRDHVHCLISLNKEQNISKVVQILKGESSFWINKSQLFKTKFSWQDDYWAVSVSESHIEKVREYILNQEKHHKYKTFNEEVEELMNEYNCKYSKSD
ncbi:MAG: hypothetical protein OHK0036_06180 [Bacteroidia bacterium]